MKKLIKLLSFSPMMVSILIVILFTFVSIEHEFNPQKFELLKLLDEKVLDLKFKFRGPELAKNRILIVAGDDKAFQTFGQWPWDRKLVFAPLIEKLCSFNPKAIVFDIVWSEHEKSIPLDIQKALVEKLPKGSSDLESILNSLRGDQVLNQSIKNCIQKVILGFSMSNSDSDGLDPEDFKLRLNRLTSSGGNTLTTISSGVKFYDSATNEPGNVQFSSYNINGLITVPEIAPEGVAQGSFNNESDSDGNYRKGLLVFRTPNGFLSSLSLRAAQKINSENDNPAMLTIVPEIPGKKSESMTIKLNGQEIPLDYSGRINVNFRGPNKTFPNLSIADVLDKNENIAMNLFDIQDKVEKQVDIAKVDAFKDSIVFVGITANVIYDIRPRPFDSAASGVENHANILDNLLSNDYLTRPKKETLLLIQIAMFIFGIVFSIVISRSSALPGMLITVSTLVIIVFLDQKYLFNRGILFSGHFQFAQILFQFLSIMTLKYWLEEKEKKYIREAFDKYVSPSIINEMLKDPDKLKIGGDKKTLTILFSDIRGFTTLSEKVDIKTLTAFLNEYLGSMTDILQKNQGTLDKFIGDAVMGFWSAPVDVEKHAEMAVKTAVEMIEKVHELNIGFKQKYNIVIDIGIGIHTGPVTVGNFGSSKVFSYTVIGDNVNLASRLESLTKHYGARILISETTYAEVDHSKYKVREMDLVKVKGKNQPVRMYEVIPDLPQYKILIDSISTHASGLKAYYAKDWNTAESEFKKVLTSIENDKSSKDMLERCEYYKANPPPADWDGSWEMHEK